MGLRAVRRYASPGDRRRSRHVDLGTLGPVPPRSKGRRKVQAAAERSAVRALKEERLALAAIGKVFVLECDNPARLLSRLEAMARNAERSPRVPVRVRRTLLHGALIVRT